MEFRTVWEENSPHSLLDIAIQCFITNIEIFLDYSPYSRDYELMSGISLPCEICDRIIHIANIGVDNDSSRSKSDDLIHRLLKIFRDPVQTRLSRVNLSNSSICDDDVEIICRHNITELNISNCSKLTDLSFSYLNRLNSSLLSLIIGRSIKIFPYSEDADFPPREDSQKKESEKMNCEPHFNHLLDAPYLRKFVVEGLAFPESVKYFYLSLRNMKYLTHLDLSRCNIVKEDKLKCLRNHDYLESLVLFDVEGLETCMDSICTLTTLRHLDISQSPPFQNRYKNPNKTLKTLIQSLPNLVSLDISGTNLAGDRVQEHEEEELLENMKDIDYSSAKAKDAEHDDDLVTDIAGLKSRVKRPLEFLGLYNTAHEACYRHHIPAIRIAGDANEEQILTAGRAYCSRPEVIEKVLNDLFHIFRFSSCQNIKLALDVVMEAMKRHIDEKHIQISGSASLFYIVKGEEKTNFNTKIKKNIIKTVLDAMFAHISDVTMIRNGCLTLIHFKIPEDVFFDYERLVNLLLLIIAQEDQDEFVQRIGVYLLNSIACQVDGKHKQLVGDHGAINVMLQLISGRLAQQLCDEVMETAWSTMWNVTDETPINCQRFLEGDGMSLFLSCLKTFPEKPELLRNMMGLLGNVAEVKELRPFLMTDEYLSVFSDLLGSKSDGIEVSYNAAGILSHIASDGSELWEQHNISLVARQTVLSRMVQAIEGWKLNTKRNINYRSFEPILRLLYVDHSPEAQYWAIWALANLTKVYPDKYCSLLKEEGGMPIIKKHSRCHSYSHVRELACMIIEQCEGIVNYPVLQ